LRSSGGGGTSFSPDCFKRSSFARSQSLWACA